MLSGSFRLFIFAAGILAITFSCRKDEVEHPSKIYGNGAFISCEGAFNANNGSITWYDDASGETVNYLFEKINGRPAGDVVHSFALAGEYGVMVANNSGKLEVVELEGFTSAATITGFSYPRRFVYAGDGRGYLSNGNLNGEVYQIDLTTWSVTDTIAVGMGPEDMIISGNHLFVANSGGWSFDNTVSVVDMGTATVVETIITGDIPVALASDLQGNIWVLCRGNVIYNETWTEIIDETESKLVRIGKNTLSADKEIVIGEKGDGFNPSWLSADGDMLYFGERDGLFAMSVHDVIQPSSPVIGEQFSYAAVHPRSGRIFAVSVTDYSSPGLLRIYEEGNLVLTAETGIAPGGIVFSGN